MLTEKEKKMKGQLEKQLRMPKLQYILVYGILLWGITMMLMLTLMDRFVYQRSFDPQTFRIRLIMMPIAGIFLGWFMRKVAEKRLKKLNEKENG